MRSVIFYLIFGVLTTLVNIFIYWLLARQVQLSVMISTIIAWVVAVLFAYFTNRKWVFHSEAVSKREIINELAAFFTCRITTGVIDIFIMYIFATLLNFDDVIVKAISNFIVIALNYLGSKFFIFVKTKGE